MTWSWVGNTYQYIEQNDYPEPERPRCNCGAFLPWKPLEVDFTYGYPGQETTEKRWVRICKKCGNHNYDGN